MGCNINQTNGSDRTGSWIIRRKSKLTTNQKNLVDGDPKQKVNGFFQNSSDSDYL